jgi:hypothetical protein
LTLNWIEPPLYSARGHSTTNSKRRFAGVASTALDEVLMLIAVTRRSKKKDRKKDGVEKKEMTFRQVTKEEKGPNIAVRSPIAEKRRRESEEKEKVKVGF